ncbi:hypothetical protein FQN57_003084 [Myotisia sp. PD_48]|nr:hypothetical protein FQN57_003084 [Myotisia sp. PD_48]
MEPDSPSSRSLNKSEVGTHLCVLIHGLWGSPKHLEYVESVLREKCTEYSLQILNVKSNSFSLTYDGIDVGGERVTYEVEEAIREASSDGECAIKKLSIVGYSLGGLVGRYVAGLLYSKGYFEYIEPVNFTTFVTPHVGVRSPARQGHFWNVFGARTLSKSGRQLFMIDTFQDTGEPLLSILAARESIFMLGLAKFKRRTLYTNIINDRSAVYYTTSISKTDPFVDLDKIVIRYLEGHAPVILDRDEPIIPKTESQSLLYQIVSSVKSTLASLPFRLLFVVVLTIATILFLINSAFQTIRSRRRIRLHHEGKSGIVYTTYRVPLIVEEFRNAVEDMYGTVNATQQPEFVSDDDNRSLLEGEPSRAENDSHSHTTATNQSVPKQSIQDDSSQSHFPTLALTQAQFNAIDNLNSVGFRKYRVYIHNARHSHAAIIVRMARKSFDEGKIVVKHWVYEEFCQ